MSRSTESAASTPFDAALAAAASRYGLSRASERAIERRFAAVRAEWAPSAAALAAFVVSVMSSGPSKTAGSSLDWVTDEAWSEICNMAAYGRVPTAALTGGRYFSITGVGGAFDLEEDAPVDSIPVDWVETRVFNLRTVFKAATTR